MIFKNIKKVNFNKKYLLRYTIISHLLFVIVSVSFVVIPTKNKIQVEKYNIYSSRPLQVNEYSYQIVSADSRAQKINNIFRDYQCPLEGLGDTFVKEADKNNIPWEIVAAISFQESNCGKKIPYINGEPTFNAWGYGVWGDNVHEFKNWVQGIEVMSRYLSKRFYQQGITDTSEIMKTYTPPSLGSWYKGVDYFINLIQNYSSI